jgi:arginine N-succinyltransferase
MPKHPIYVLFLREEAREAIGKPHPNSKKALEMLEGEGFHYENYIDIFDGGPTVECRRDDIHAVHASKRRSARSGPLDDPVRCLVSNTRLRDFRCTTANAHLEDDDSVILDPETAQAIRIEEGERVRVLRL